jgi:serine acetyltransferase
MRNIVYPCIFQRIIGQMFYTDPCTYIGANAVILGTVQIGFGSVIAAGSVVLNDVKQCTFVSGVPAKYVCMHPEPLAGYTSIQPVLGR